MKTAGIILVDKPKGWTSHDVVAKVRGTLRREAGQKVKVGHTGTLDPLASGLMILVIGSYCKRAAEFSKLDKTYEVTMKLGETSTTGDAEGEIKQISDKKPSKKELEVVLEDFIGEIKQVPPVYSAIKVDGERAYKLARAGKEVKLESRKVTIYSIKLHSYAYPFAKFTCSVSSGTYIRSLVEDIGAKLGTGAYLTDLRRTKVGAKDIRDASTIDKIIKV